MESLLYFHWGFIKEQKNIRSAKCTPYIFFALERRERDWLLRRLKSAPLRLSHPLAAEALASPTLARSYFVAAFCSLCLCMQASLRIGIKNKKMSFDIFLLRLVLRRERDSNPRNSCPFTAFRVRPDRPLRHLSFSIPVVSECKYSNYFTKSYIFRKKTKKNLFFLVSRLQIPCQGAVVGEIRTKRHAYEGCLNTTPKESLNKKMAYAGTE